MVGPGDALDLLAARLREAEPPLAAHVANSRERPVFGLLAGDYLYALGIDRLATLGDTEAVAVLGDLIGRCAQLHAEERLDEVASLWRSAALAVGGRDHDDRPPA